MSETVWMMPPYRQGEPREVEATPAQLVPLMITGWSQCPPPEKENHVDDETPRNSDLLR
jgi:hypothetical protein